MRKLFTLVAAAALAFSACTKEEAPVAGNGAEMASVIYSVNAPAVVTTQNAPGLRNAGTRIGDSGFEMNDIKAFFFNAASSVTTQVSTITGNIDWTKDTEIEQWIGSWKEEALKVPMGNQFSFVVLNSAGVTIANNVGTGLNAIRFHLNGTEAPAAAISPDTTGVGINAIAVSNLIAQNITSTKSTYTLNASAVARINSMVNVNMGYDHETMFNNSYTEAQAYFRVKSITISNVPENVNYLGADASGTVTIAQVATDGQIDGSELIVDNDVSASTVTEPVTTNVTIANNVLRTLAFPAVSGAVKLDVVLEYTTNAGVSATFNTLTLAQISLNELKANKQLNVNIWLKDLRGNVKYDMTFVDWTGAEDQHVIGEEQ